MAVEAKRGCGYRRIGGIYLEGGTGGLPCGKLPLRLVPCALCDHVQPFTRGLARIRPRAILHANPTCPHAGTAVCAACPLGQALETEQAGLLWVGDRFYTPDSFLAEANQLGVSRRLPHYPTWLEIGKTWVFVAHRKRFSEPCAPCGQTGRIGEHTSACASRHAGAAVGCDCEREGECEPCGGGGTRYTPGVFYAFQPTAIAKIIGDDTPEETRERLIKRGYKLVVVPRDDPDHAPPKRGAGRAEDDDE